MPDKAFDRYNFLIHDYFFAKALDQVRPGGVIAFITSKGTMDKQSPEVRKYIAQRAELLGAIRLPNTAFSANANTYVTSDIIFLPFNYLTKVQIFLELRKLFSYYFMLIHSHLS